jgi:hypothetical protein
MKKKSIVIRAIKFSPFCGSLILLMAVYKMLTTNLVVTTIEIFGPFYEKRSWPQRTLFNDDRCTHFAMIALYL